MGIKIISEQNIERYWEGRERGRERIRSKNLDKERENDRKRRNWGKREKENLRQDKLFP